MTFASRTQFYIETPSDGTFSSTSCGAGGAGGRGGLRRCSGGGGVVEDRGHEDGGWTGPGAGVQRPVQQLACPRPPALSRGSTGEPTAVTAAGHTLHCTGHQADTGGHAFGK